MLRKSKNFIVAVIKHEPVALWGILAAVVLQVVLPLIHASWIVSEIPVVLTILGIPIVRSRVSPAQALAAVVADTQQAVTATLQSNVVAPVAPATPIPAVTPVVPATAETVPPAVPAAPMAIPPAGV